MSPFVSARRASAAVTICTWGSFMSAPLLRSSATPMPGYRPPPPNIMPVLPGFDHETFAPRSDTKNEAVTLLRYRVAPRRFGEPLLQVRRPRALERQRRAGPRVSEAELGRVQRHPGRGRRERTPIARVADHRRADLDHVQPDLVRPPRLEPTGHERRPVAEPFPDLDVRDGAPPPDRPIDHLYLVGEAPDDRREVGALEIVVA